MTGECADLPAGRQVGTFSGHATRDDSIRLKTDAINLSHLLFHMEEARSEEDEKY